MYFTDEEKEIIKKISIKNRYSIDDFLNDTILDRENIKIGKALCSVSTKYDFHYFVRDSDEDCYLFKENYRSSLDKFIKVWTMLKETKLIIEINNSALNIEKNIRNLIIKNDKGIYVLNNILYFEFEDFLTKELIVIQSDLQDFINDGYKTKEEIEQEQEILARNQALADSRDSVKYAQESVIHSRTSVEISKISLKWTIGVAVVSGFISIISLGFSINSYNKETEVKVKNLNEINIQQLEAQLKLTNAELNNIKIKIEALQKPSQKSTNK